MSEDSNLTESGWPRPVVDGWPVPWVSPSDDLSQMDAGRKVQIGESRLCQVCGAGFADSDRVWFLVQRAPDESPLPDPEHTAARPMDDAVMHERCYKLAVGRCPVLRDLASERSLVACTAVASDVSALPNDITFVVPVSALTVEGRVP